MEKANYTTVVDTPEIIHAHHVKNFSSKVMMALQMEVNSNSREP